jgi:two-component system, sensor histidine kinase YesM
MRFGGVEVGLRHSSTQSRYISIRSKLIFSYFFCVLLPIMAVALFFYTEIVKMVDQEQKQIIQQAIDQAGNSIQRNIDEAIAISNKLYSDNRMYEILDQTYDGSLQSYDIVESYIKVAWQSILPYNSKVRSFAVFTDNTSLLQCNYIGFISANGQTDKWIEEFAKQGEQITLVSYPGSVRSQISFIRRLDYDKYYNQYVKLLKIDFEPDMLYQILRSNSIFGGVLYVVDESGRILASSSEIEDSRIRFGEEKQVKVLPDQIEIEQDISSVSRWRVVGVFNKNYNSKAFIASRNKSLIILTLVVAFASLVITLVAGSIYKRVVILAKHMRNIEKGEFTQIDNHLKGNDELGYLITVMNQMSMKIKLLIEDVAKARDRQMLIELEKKQAELNALQSQVDPHFMFNVLETVRMKSYLKNEFETARIIKFMSKMFRKLIQWDEDIITVEEEIVFIKEFLEIQRYRFDDELKFHIQASEETLQQKIPKMLLQTFVENACVHGIETTGRGCIHIEVTSGDRKLRLLIWDNGAGMDQEKLLKIKSLLDNPNQQTSSVGIKNVIKRLKLYFDDNFEFKVSSEVNRYTSVELVLPLTGKGESC